MSVTQLSLDVLPSQIPAGPFGNGMWIEGRGEGVCGTWILLLQVWMVTIGQNDLHVSYSSWHCDKILDRSSVGEEGFGSWFQRISVSHARILWGSSMVDRGWRGAVHSLVAWEAEN